MNKRMTELLDFEKRLLQNREELQKLMAESETGSSQLIREKLEFFNQEIEHMNRQVRILKYDLEKSTEPVCSLAKENVKETNPDLQKIQSRVEQQKTVEQQHATVEQEQLVQQEAVERKFIEASREIPHMQTPTAVRQKKDLEKTIGKSFMGVFASVLIFISLILFATLLLPYFNDTAKMVTSYLIGFVFTGVGLMKLMKAQQNKFFIALTGCGIGVIYISLLLSNIYFKVLGDISLYMLICIWGVGVCLLSRLQHKIFQVIGELGIMISLIFGCGLCGTNNDAAKFVALIIFYMITSAIFYLVHYQVTFAGNSTHHGFHIINCAILLITCADLFRKEFHIAEWLVLFVIAFGFGSMLLNRLERSNVSFGFFSAMYLYQLYGILARIFEKDAVFGSIAYAVCMLLLLWIEWKPADKKGGKYFVQGNLILFMTMALVHCESVFSFGVILLIVLPILFLGFARKNTILKYGSIIILLFYTFDSGEMRDLEHFVLEGIALAVAIVCIYIFKEQHSQRFKNVIHVLAIVFIMTCLGDTIHEFVHDYSMERTVVFMVGALFNIVMKKTIFGRNLATGEPEPPALYNSVNLYFMVSGVGLLNFVDGVWKFFLILMVIATFMVNAKNMLDNRGNMIGGMYVGFKFTILMIAILNSFSAENYIVSVACLIFAIICIMIGFMAQYKSLRIFGLILSMVSIFKLIMVDINYDNTLGNALSFFVSGILCFVISLIYNFIDGKVNQKQEL